MHWIIATADFDGDGNNELITSKPSGILAVKANGKPSVHIFTATGVASAPLTGNYDSERAVLLSAFDGIDASGEWIPNVVGEPGGDTGSLFNWTLHVTT